MEVIWFSIREEKLASEATISEATRLVKLKQFPFFLYLWISWPYPDRLHAWKDSKDSNAEIESSGSGWRYVDGKLVFIAGVQTD